MTRRWLLLAAPALALAFVPPACSGTESGNPRCATPDTCRIDLELNGGPSAGGIQQASRGFLDGHDAAPVLRLLPCAGLHDEGELRWSVEDATRDPDGSLTVRPASTSDGEPSWIDPFGRRLVVGGALTITPEATVSGELQVVQAGFDAAAGPLETLRIEGELDVICRDGDPGVVLGAADGSGVLVQCNSTHVETPPCDDTPSAC